MSGIVPGPKRRSRAIVSERWYGVSGKLAIWTGVAAKKPGRLNAALGGLLQSVPSTKMRIGNVSFRFVPAVTTPI